MSHRNLAVLMWRTRACPLRWRQSRWRTRGLGQRGLPHHGVGPLARRSLKRLSLLVPRWYMTRNGRIKCAKRYSETRIFICASCDWKSVQYPPFQGTPVVNNLLPLTANTSRHVLCLGLRFQEQREAESQADNPPESISGQGGESSFAFRPERL